jgi:deoxyribodipyrimidine photolyase
MSSGNESDDGSEWEALSVSNDVDVILATAKRDLKQVFKKQSQKIYDLEGNATTRAFDKYGEECLQKAVVIANLKRKLGELEKELEKTQEYKDEASALKERVDTLAAENEAMLKDKNEIKSEHDSFVGCWKQKALAMKELSQKMEELASDGKKET